MSRSQQPSIRSFFQPKSQPAYASPPSDHPLDSTTTEATNKSASPPAPPPAPPLPQITGAANPTHFLATNVGPVLPPPPSLPSGATIVPLAEQHIPALRRINSLLLPVAYPDSFYAKALDPLTSGLFSRAILWQDSTADTPKVVGGLICRLEPNHFVDAHGQPLPWSPLPTHGQNTTPASLNTPYHAIYIQSLALLSPFRSLGLAAAALEHIIASAALLPASGSGIDARTIYAHVWTENEEGLKWYEARGFARHGQEPVKGYYFKLRPDTAWIVRRDIATAGSLPSANQPQPSLSSIQPQSSTTIPGSRGAGSVLAAAVNLPPISSSMAPSPSSSPSPAAVSLQPTQGGAAATVTNGTGAPRRPPPTATTPSSSTSSLSFQNMRPETEWNDLPADMVGRNQHLSPNSGPRSNASSRSSSTARKKKERAYPSAAFGN